jgi:hypothetical protein
VDVFEHVAATFIASKRARRPGESNIMQVFQKRLDTGGGIGGRLAHRLTNSDDLIGYISPGQSMLKIAHLSKCSRGVAG